MCLCAGCKAIAIQTVRMAHMHCAHIFSNLTKTSDHNMEMYKNVGEDLMHIVYYHICLLLCIECKQSPCHAALWRVKQCLKEWERLSEMGIKISIDHAKGGQVFMY